MEQFRLSELEGIIEALLFVSDEPLSAKKVAELAETDEKTAEETLKGLAERYARENRGFQLREVAGGFRLYTHPAYAPYVEKLVLSGDYRRLTQAALETLAIIAYKQPVTRAEISAIRGVNVEGVLNSLIDKGLVKEVGRMDAPGAPILYGTTKAFLEALGLKDLSELPPLEEFAPSEEEKEKIRRQLTAERLGEKEENSLEDNTLGEEDNLSGEELEQNNE